MYNKGLYYMRASFHEVAVEMVNNSLHKADLVKSPSRHFTKWTVALVLVPPVVGYTNCAFTPSALSMRRSCECMIP